MIIEALKYKIWADARTVSAIDKVDITASFKAYAFMLQQLNHMIIVEDLFKSRLENNPAPHGSTNSKNVPDFDELKQRLVASGKWYLAFVSPISNDRLEDIVSFTFADGKSGSMSTVEILFHIVNHGSYHRGSIAHALDLAKVTHPADGYGIYIHEKYPKRRERNKT